jgi:hypothetical protein
MEHCNFLVICYFPRMCAKQSLRQPASARVEFNLPSANKIQLSSLAPVNTVRSGYHNWRSTLRGVGRSPVRNDAGRNALSGVKVSSPVKQVFPVWPSKYAAAKATLPTPVRSTLGVQVHGMYRRLSQELGRSPASRTMNRIVTQRQGLKAKSKVTPAGEVRWLRSSETQNKRKLVMKEVG